MVYWNLGDLAQAVHYVSRCVQLNQEISHPDLESDSTTLVQRVGNKSVDVVGWKSDF